MVSPQKVKANLSFGPTAGNPKFRKMKVWGQVSAGCGKNVADPKPNTTENEATNSQLCNCSDRACVCTVPTLRALPNEQRPRGDVTVFVSAMDVLGFLCFPTPEHSPTQQWQPRIKIGTARFTNATPPGQQIESTLNVRGPKEHSQKA